MKKKRGREGAEQNWLGEKDGSTPSLDGWHGCNWHRTMALGR